MKQFYSIKNFRMALLAMAFLSPILMHAETHEVMVSSNKFTPQDLIIQIGDTVKWVNTEGKHNVNGSQETYSGNPESFINGEAATGDWTYSFQFSMPGTYDYQCDPHAQFGMVGTVTVLDGSATIHEVIVSNGKFTPKDLIIKAGDAVKWMQVEGSHNVNGSQDTYPDNPESFMNGPAASGDWTYSFLFSMPGTYDYQCDPHAQFGMVGTVTVLDGSATIHEVIVSNGKFTPKDLIIKAGDAVKWMQIEGAHNVNGSQETYPDNPESFMNGEAASGDWTYSFLFTMPGTYDYQCDPHAQFGMVGTVTVLDGSATIHEVIVSNGKFTPKDLIIKAGDAVKWMQIEGAHNVNGSQETYPDNPESFMNGEAASGDWTYSFLFTMPGTYDYQCDPHAQFGMVGTVTVLDGSATIHEVIVSNGKFTPKDLIIKAGDAVKWMQVEGSHNVNGSQETYPDNPESFMNGPAASGDWTYSFLFTMPGTYDYQCDPHAQFGMVGTVTVLDGSATIHEVIVSNGKFTPKDLIIKAGDAVKWMQIEGAHNVNGSQETYPDNPESFMNGPAASGDWTYSFLFTMPGTYDYQCDPHAQFGMVGTVTVLDGSATIHEVIVSNGKFTPKDLIIKAGDAVKWMQIEGAHNVNGSEETYPDNPESFMNGEAASGDWTYSFLFTMPGTYDYQCDPHAQFGMVGTVTVLDGSATIHEVIVSNGKFTPKDLIIKAGDAVKWMQIEGAHNVNGSEETYPDNPESFMNGEAASGDWTYSFLFTMPGTYDYQCDPHAQFGMVGTVTVLDGSATIHEVIVSNGKFTPKDLIIKAGDAVKWMQVEGSHNVNGSQDTYPDNPESFMNGEAASGDWTYSFLFTMPGKYDYQCDPHVQFGMVGTVTVTTTTGIKGGVAERAKILPYPNPTESTLFFNLEGNLGNEVIINIYNLAGNLVKSINAEIAETNKIETSELITGYYHLQIVTDGKRYQSKFIKK